MTHARFRHFDANTAGRDFVVGDVHGHFSLLQLLLDDVGFKPDVDRLFSVGDLVDRGPESHLALDWLAKPWFFAVAGNHELLAVDALDTRNNAEHYIMNGGLWFYNLSDLDKVRFARAFMGLPTAIEIDTANGLVGLVHAEVPGDNWNDLRHMLTKETSNAFRMAHVERHAYWGRDIVRGRREFNGVEGVSLVCVGHTPVKTVTSICNVMYVDTGACFGRKLSMVNITEDKFYEIEANDDRLPA